MEKTRLQLAQWFAGRGVSVFIVEPMSKRPLDGYSWYIRQSTDPATIATWFEQVPDANFGCHWGEKFVAIDLDIKPQHNGVKAFEDLCREYGIDNFLLELDTLIVQTPSGGYHVVFQAPFPCANKNSFPDGIDVRGINGYTVGAGSEDTRGEWRVISDAEITPLPEWLTDYLEKPGYRDPNSDVPVVELDLDQNVEYALEWLRDREPALQGQNGDDWTYETVQFLRDFDLSQDKIFETLNVEWNGRCDPPWGHEELLAKIRNAWSYGQNRPGVKSPTWKAQRVLMGHGQGVWADHLTEEAIAELFRPTRHLTLAVDNTDGNTARKIEPEDDDIPEDVPDDEVDPVTGAHIEQESLWLDVLDFAKRGRVRKYVIHNWLIAHGIIHLIARRGTGKSTVALDMGMRIACDLDWCGIPTQRGWKVIYLCLEDDEGLELNINAWMQKHGHAPERGRCMVRSDVLKLTDERRLNMRVREMVQWADGVPCVVILDTWQRATAGHSKNDAEAMEQAIERAERIASYLNGPLLSCVHPPKDGRMTVTGAGVQEDTSTGILNLEKEIDGVKLTVNRMKGPGEGQYMKFELQQITLTDEKNEPRLDAFEKPLTGLVAIKIGGGEDAASLIERASDKQTLRYNALAKACLEEYEADVEKARDNNCDPQPLHPRTMAGKLVGTRLDIADGTKWILPTTDRAMSDHITAAFENPRKFDGGKVLDLVDTAGTAGKTVKVFRLRVLDTATDDVTGGSE